MPPSTRAADNGARSVAEGHDCMAVGVERPTATSTRISPAPENTASAGETWLPMPRRQQCLHLVGRETGAGVEQQGRRTGDDGGGL